MGKLNGKVAIVTGGTSGMGKSTSILFAKEGAKVVVTGRNKERGEQVVDFIKKNGGEAIFIQADLSKMNEIENLVTKTVEVYETIDIVINNAAFYSTTPMMQLSLEEMQYSFDVNVKAPFYLAKLAAPYMQRNVAGAGRVVNISSVAGAQSKYGCVAYAATKHAVLGLTRAMGRELGPEIRTNCVMPGAVMTPMLEPGMKNPESRAIIDAMVVDSNVKRIGEPEEVAHVNLFLASDDSSFMAGQCMRVDGGLDL